MKRFPPTTTSGWALAALTLGLSLGWFWLDGNVGVNLADEGYLWYGVRAVARGAVPMRDFQAYDPGRYLWGALWSRVLGEDLVALRLSCVFFQCLGILAGLLAARRLSDRPLFLGSVALLLCVWMQPRYKVFEQSIALMAVYAGVLLLERPTLRRHFSVGLFGGVSAFFGRNHGAYHVLAFGLIIAWAARGGAAGTLRRSAVAWIAGLLLGYLPQWAMFFCVPGYFHAFTTELSFILAKGTNLSRAVPWPWRVPVMGLRDWLPALAEGCFYLLLPIFLLLAMVRLWRAWSARETHPVLLSATGVGLGYTHYVFSRADLGHLAHGAPVIILGILALAAASELRWPRLLGSVVVWLLSLSALANLPSLGLQTAHTPVEVGGRKMLASLEDARVLETARTLARDWAHPDEGIFFAPNLCTLYPFTNRTSPTRQIYFIFPATADEQREVLAEMEVARLRWAFIYDYPLDGRAALRFPKTHPLVWEYLQTHFEFISIDELPPAYSIWRRRD